ncbi:MAG TPA: site-specific integrase, partial [Burkholderiaceae bacterium]|nr:site-specific integrase [Burkholderiaceae bacterium]
MSKFAIREAKLPSGEGLPLLVMGHRLGLPVPLALRYILVRCRPSGKKANTIRQKLGALSLGLQFFETRHIELTERAATRQFLDIDELAALSERCRQRDDDQGVVTPSYAATRYATCIDYVRWFSEGIIRRITAVRRRENANNALHRFIKRAKLSSPSSNNHHSNIPGERLGFTPAQRDLFRACIKPGAIGNPFGAKVQLRNYAMLLLALELGPRPGEVLGLKVRDIDFSQNPAALMIHRRHDDPDDKRRVRPETKTNGRLLQLAPWLRDVLYDWIASRRLFFGAKKHPYVFINYRGDPITDRGYRRIIETLRRH